MSVSPRYLYIIVEDGPEGLKLVRSFDDRSWASNAKRIRVYTQEGHARNALKLFGRGKILRVDIVDGDIL